MGTAAIISLIFAILSTAATVGAGIYSNQQNRQIAERNWEEADEAREDSQEFAQGQQETANRTTIEMFNAMDSPEAKRRQLENAGLSVGLMYGGGGQGGSAHSSAMSGTPSGGAANVAPFINPIFQAMQTPNETFKTLKEGKKTDAEIANTMKRNEEIDQKIEESKNRVNKLIEETKSERLKQTMQEIDNEQKELDLNYSKATYSDRVNLMTKQVEMLDKNIEKVTKEIDILDIEKSKKEELLAETIKSLRASTAKSLADASLSFARAATEKLNQKLIAAKTETEKQECNLIKQKIDEATAQTNILQNKAATGNFLRRSANKIIDSWNDVAEWLGIDIEIPSFE